MPIKVTCSKCGGVLHAPDDSGGKRGKCPTCAAILNIPADGPRSAGVAVTPAAADHPFREPSNLPAGKSRMTGAIGFADVADPPRAAAVPPPGFHPPEPRPVPTRSALRSAPLPGPDDESDQVAAVGWRAVRRGLGWIRFGTVLLVLAAVAPAAVFIVRQKSPDAIPNKDPGFLGIAGLNSVEEISLGSGLVPAALGLLCCLFGRVGFARAPRSSFTRGLARLTFLAELVAVGGLIAAAVPSAMQLSKKVVPTGFADPGTADGMLQRLGLAAAAAGAVASGIWIVVAIGKIGASLHQRSASARSGRLVALVGLLVAAAIVSAVGYHYYPTEMTSWWADNVQGKLDFGPDTPVARAGAVIAGALVVGLIYLRLIGAGRRAVREWLAQHPQR